MRFYMLREAAEWQIIVSRDQTAPSGVVPSEFTLFSQT